MVVGAAAYVASVRGPNIDLCFMTSITLFSLEEAAKQLDTVVENHFQILPPH
jgi:hypothetical protein